MVTSPEPWRTQVGTDAAPESTWPIEVRPNGTVIYDGIAIGGLDLVGTAPRLTVNLGWCRLAGLSVTVQGDPDVDRKRGGVVLSR